MIQEVAASEQAHANPFHFAPRAKRVIFMFMKGGPSQVDTFDYKPKLQEDDGKPLPFAKPRVQFAPTGNLLGSPWRFRQYGESGIHVSELFPNVAQHVDDICFLNSVHGTNAAHGGAALKLHTGSDAFVRPRQMSERSLPPLHQALYWRRLAHWGASRGPEWWVRYSPPVFGWAAGFASRGLN